MKLTRSMPDGVGLLFLAPVVNVILLLLLFFLLSSSFVMQPGVAVALPFSPFTMGPQLNPLILTITSGPQPKIIFDEREMSLNELGRSLSRLRGSDRAIIVRADRNSPYDLVVSAMNEALQQGLSVTLATTQQAK